MCAQACGAEPKCALAPGPKLCDNGEQRRMILSLTLPIKGTGENQWQTRQEFLMFTPEWRARRATLSEAFSAAPPATNDGPSSRTDYRTLPMSRRLPFIWKIPM